MSVEMCIVWRDVLLSMQTTKCSKGERFMQSLGIHAEFGDSCRVWRFMLSLEMYGKEVLSHY